MQLYYFGTSPDNAGHYLWELAGEGYYKAHRLRMEDLPFNPEGLPHTTDNTYRNGRTEFYDFAGFLICAIEGSCYDKRRGSKSIFFVRAPNYRFTHSDLKHFILSVPIARRIIEQMEYSFKIEW